MAYVPYITDLSPLLVDDVWPGVLMLQVGWLSGDSVFPCGEVELELTRRLRSMLKYECISTLGLHRCGLCGGTFEVCVDGSRRQIGQGDIYVRGDGVWYCAPNLIIHYIEGHGYLPPQEFVRAVVCGPQPDSREYKLEILSLMRANHVLCAGLDWGSCKLFPGWPIPREEMLELHDILDRTGPRH